MYECFHCCTRSVVWDADFDFSDFGYEGEGIVHICHCANCGAEIEYRVSCDDELKSVVMSWLERSARGSKENERRGF